MTTGGFIQTNNLDQTFRALKHQDPSKIRDIIVPNSPEYKSIPNQNYAPTTSSRALGSGMTKFAGASTNSGIVYGQPQFFSPVHTPINWQIPSKRLEIYQWQTLPNTQVLTEDFTYITLENAPFVCKEIIEDTLTSGYIFETSDYPKIMNSEGGFNRPPRISMRDCNDKRCFSFKPVGNYRKLRVSEEHCLFVLDGKSYRKNKKILGGRKYRTKKGIVSNGVEKVKIQNKLIKRIQAQEISRTDYLLTPVPQIGKISLSKDLAWLIGFCVADGCISNSNGCYRVCFTGCKDEVALMRCKEILESHFNSTISSREHGDGKGWRITVTTKKAYDFFRTYIVNKGIEKKLSKAVFDLDKESRLNIIAGYFDGGGCLAKAGKTLIANCYSKDLADQIYWLLISCQIVSSLGKHPLYGEHYPTDSDCCYRIFIPSSQVTSISSYMKGDKVSSNFIPKKERELKFFYTEDEVTYLAQPIDKIEEFLYTGKGFDIEMTNEKHALVADGYISSNCRFFYESEPKVASSIDFYSFFPMNDFENECKDRRIKKHFDALKKRLDLSKWLRLMSHEIHLLGDCFPLVEISCDACGGSGRTGDELCEHSGGTIRRIVILNPDFVEVITAPMNPDPIIALRPDEELINMVQKKTPGYEKLTPEVRALIASGKPIRLDNRNVFHLKYGESGYSRYGTGMVRRLFPILSYKTKLMVAQWIVAERLIVPMKIVKVGSEERPAGPADIAAVQEQLAQTANDPNLTIVTHHAFELDWVGASGKVLTLSNEFELINQEILDGMMINNALLNGEGPSYSNAAVGMEAMIERLHTFRREMANWIEQKLYLPEAIRQGFVDKDNKDKEDGDEEEYIYPKVKWNPMHLRDQQQFRTFVLQLYEKGLLSVQTVLEVFDFDPDLEVERKRYDAVQMMALGQGAGAGAGGGMGGGFGGGGGGMPPMGGDIGGGGGMPPMGGEAPISAPPEGGGAPAAPAMATEKISITAQNEGVADPSQYGGKILKKKTRERLDSQREKVYKPQEEVDPANMPGMRDAKGRIVFTKCERQLVSALSENQKNGLIKYPIVPQFPVKFGNIEYPIDFAINALKIGIEADGETFHSSPKQIAHDKGRDMKLAQAGWTILRFKDSEIDKNINGVIRTILKTIMQKEALIQKQNPALKE